MRGLGQQESNDPNAVNKDTGARGKWQVLPSNWAAWAKAAGLSPTAPMTADNQRTVVRHKLMDYFIAFGSWDEVARSWYSGPLDHARHSDIPEGRYPSINSYARSVLSRVGPLPC